MRKQGVKVEKQHQRTTTNLSTKKLVKRVEKHHLLQAVTTQEIMLTIVVVIQAIIVQITTLEITIQEIITQTARITQSLTIQEIITQTTRIIQAIIIQETVILMLKKHLNINSRPSYTWPAVFLI